jgi:hypothetical protein
VGAVDVDPQTTKPPSSPTAGRIASMSGDGPGVESLREILRRYRGTRARGVTVDERPGCVYGMLTREQLEDLVRDIEQLKSTLNRIYVSVVLMLVGLVVNTLLSRLGVV